MIEINKKTLLRIFLIGSACIVLYWLLHATEDVSRILHNIAALFAPFITGAAIAFVINVPMRGIERHLFKISNASVRRGIAIILTLVVFFLIIAMVFWLLIPQVIETVRTLTPQVVHFFDNVGTQFEIFLEVHPDLGTWIKKNTNFEEINWAVLVQNVLSMAGKSFSTIASQTASAIGSVTGFFVNFFVGIVFAIYCLFQKETLARQGRKILYAFFPERFADGTIRILQLSNSTFSNFFSGQCVEVCILGTMFAVSMAIFRMPYIPLVSVLVAVTAFVPVVGAWIGCILGAFLIMVDNVSLAVWFVLMFLILQQIENNLIYPRVVGTSIGLPGMWVLVAVAVGGKLMGVVGMFLMIPATSVLYAILREYTNLRLQRRNVPPSKLISHFPDQVPISKGKKKKNFRHSDKKK